MVLVQSKKAGAACVTTIAAVFLIVFSTVGCSDTAEQDAVTTTPPAEEESEPAGTTTEADEGAQPTTTVPEEDSAAEPPASEDELTVEQVTTGLVVPWEMRFLPDGTLLVTERGGRVVMVDLDSGQQTPVGQIDVAAIGESGLMGFDLDPEFPDEPYIYVAYTYEDDGLWNRLSRFELSDQTLGSETILVDAIPGARIHDGSRVAFGPEGYLWMTTGDAGRGELAQDRDSLAGKVLRMEKDGSPAPDNPFADSPIYTWGHRNPQGLDFHPQTGTPFVTEHGPDTDDEINRLVMGDNYGWPEVRGPSDASEYHDPIMAWTPTIAPAGGVFYDADAIPGWRGAFVLATLKESDLRLLEPANGEFTEVAQEIVLYDEAYGRLRPMAVGPDGAVYVGTSNRDGRGSPGPEDDRILKIAPK